MFTNKIGVVTTRLLPGTAVNYSTGSACCMNQLGTVQVTFINSPGL